MKKLDKYIKVDWPDSQYFCDKKGCYNVCDDPPLVFVPEDFYEEVMYKLEFPKKYENTNIGTVVCYETRAVVNGEDIFWYDISDLKKGNRVLIYNHDTKEWIITTCAACTRNMPILVEDKNCIIDVNSEIIGHNNLEIFF